MTKVWALGFVTLFALCGIQPAMALTCEDIVGKVKSEPGHAAIAIFRYNKKEMACAGQKGKSKAEAEANAMVACAIQVKKHTGKLKTCTLMRAVSH